SFHYILGNLATGLTAADDKYRSRREGGWAAVVGGIDLEEVRRYRRGAWRSDWTVQAASCDDHVSCPPSPSRGSEPVSAVAILRELGHRSIQFDCKRLRSAKSSRTATNSSRVRKPSGSGP